MADYKLRQIIAKKRDGHELSAEEIAYFVDVAKKTTEPGAKGAADRSQIGAMLMAAYLNGLSDLETNELTLRMRDSGRVFQWPDGLRDRIVDKHSTGGVGDKISLVLVPALAACDLLVPMISGRSLGHTGGTLDKLEAIDQFTVSLSDAEIMRAVEGVGCCIAGQTRECVPADKVLYECRDLTSTIDYPPFITASIVSKKLSENPSALVYDVKFGKGSFFKTPEDALETAKGLVKASCPVRAVALLTSMDAPIGRAIGDSLEVLETVECLKGRGPSDVIQLVEALGKELLHLTGVCGDLTGSLKDGRALHKFADMLLLQHATKEAVKDLCYGEASDQVFKESRKVRVARIVYKGKDGFVSSIDPLVLGMTWKEEYSNTDHNPRVGFLLMKTVGDAIQSGDAWLQFHHERDVSKQVWDALCNAIEVSELKPERKLVEKRVFMKDGCVVVEDYD